MFRTFYDLLIFNNKFKNNSSEQEKAHRWEEIRIRQHRLINEAENVMTSNMDHIMKSGFTMNDIKNLHRNFDEAEADEHMGRNGGPNRPPRKGSLSRPGPAFDPPALEVNGVDGLQRSTSALDMQRDGGGDHDDKRKRGRSPFRLFGKKRDQSKDKVKAQQEDAQRRPMSKFFFIYFLTVKKY